MLLFYLDSCLPDELAEEAKGVEFPEDALVFIFGFMKLKKITENISGFDIDENKICFPHHLIDDEDLKYATRKIATFLREDGWGKGFPRFPIAKKKIFWIKKEIYTTFLQLLEMELVELIDSKAQGGRRITKKVSDPIFIPSKKEFQMREDPEDEEARYLRAIEGAKAALKKITGRR
jgi:hypothetical protein